MEEKITEDLKIAQKELWLKIKAIKFCMLTSLRDNMVLHSRPMTTQQIEFDGSLWFFTSENTSAAKEIQQEHQVNATFADLEHNIYISLSGTANIVHDENKAKELWHPLCKAWFPKGVNDPALRLLKVDVHEAEIWDSPSSKMVQLYSIAKAIVTGSTAYNMGEHKKIETIVT